MHVNIHLSALYVCMSQSTSSECPDKEVITHKLLAEEDSLPFDADTFHLVVSNLRFAEKINKC